ncbi:MAG: AraC family transcriptional regulator [Eubacteriales bacterium]
MTREKKELRIEHCTPKVLFTWQGSRKESEKEMHNHDFLELAFVLSGVGQYCIDGEIIDVEAGDLIIFNPGTNHKAIIPNHCEQKTTEFFVGFSDFKLREYPMNFIPLSEKGNKISTSSDLRQQISKLCLAMTAEKEMWKVGRYFLLNAYLTQLLMLVIREESLPIKEDIQRYSFESVNRKHVVSKMVEYFDEHYNEKISLEHIAENMYLSPFYISRIFKSELGESPINYLINIRMKRAKELLETSEKISVQKVASLVGYTDAYYFSRLFKKKYGYPPSKVHKNNLDTK